MQSIQATRTCLPKWVSILVILACLLPFGLQYVPAVQKYEINSRASYQPTQIADYVTIGKLSPDQRKSLIKNQLPTQMMHAFSEFAGFMSALLTLMGIVFHYTLQRKPWYAILGICFVFVGFFDLLQFLAFDRFLVSASAFTQFIPMSWLSYRIAATVFPLLGLLAISMHKITGVIKNWMFFLVISGILAGLSFSAIQWQLFSENLPSLPQSFYFLKNAFCLAPLAILCLLSLPFFWAFNRKTQSVFSHALLISLIPNICLDLFVLLSPFGYEYTYATSPFAHYLEILFLLVPLVGIIIENYNFYILIQISQKITQKASQAKSRFIRSVSTELRTPLEVISGFSRGLLGKIDGPINETQQGSLQKIFEASESLSSLVNEVLDVAQIEAGRLIMNLQKQNIIPIIDSTIKTLARKAQEKKLEVHFDNPYPEFFLNVDHERFPQILINILNNAIENTEQGSITVRIKAENDLAEISVQDTGKGISEENLPHIFEPFSQSKEVSSQNITKGLGLKITQNLVEGHYGSIKVESKENEGSTFTILLPCTTEAAQVLKTTDPSTTAGP